MNEKLTYKELEQRVQELEASLQRIGSSGDDFQANALQKGNRDIDQFQKALSLVGETLHSTKNVDFVINNILETVFTLFKCDRIWLFYPCDPTAPTFNVLAEKNSPEYPGAFASGQELPVTPEAALTIQKALDSGVPTVFDPESGNDIDDVGRKFSVLSQIIMAVHPKIGEPWMFGMHQCSYARVWTTYEQHLFQEISCRVVESLSNRILLDDLKKSELKYKYLLENLPQKIFHKNIHSVYVSCNKNYARDLGIDPDKIAGTTDYDYFPKDLADKYINDDKYITTSGNSDDFIERYVTAGQESWVHTVKVPLFDDRGNVSGVLGIFRDITEQKEAEEALKESLNFNQLILQSSPVGILIFKESGPCVMSNPAAARISGTTEKKLLQLNYKEMESYKNTGILEAMQEVFETGKIIQKEVHTINTFKNDVWFDGILSTFQIQGEKHLLFLFQDIWDRKKMEERFVKQFAEFKAIFNSITDAIVFVDTHRHIIMVNPAFADIFGYSLEEVLGKTTQLFYANPEEYSQQGNIRYNMNAKIDSPVYEVQYRRKDNSVFTSETLGVPVIDAKGETIGFLGIIRDITERVTAEKTLRENRAKLETALASMTDGICISNCLGELIDFNKAWALFYRFRNKDECLKRLNDYPDLFEIILANGKPAPIETWPASRALRGETETNAEHTIRQKDTGETWMGSFSFGPIRNDQDVIVGSVVVTRDITELKQREAAQHQLEYRLRQAQKMEAIGTLAGGIAHDFNNILSAILGYTEMAKEDAPPGTQFTKDLDQVLSAGNRAKDLVKQILAFSRQSQVERIPIKMQSVIKEGVKMLRSSIPTTISITEDIDPQSGPVLADPTQVHQILMNLCTNAYHALELTGGTLSITVKTTFIGSDEQEMLVHVSPGEYIELTVTDTGVGIGPDVIEKIFDPYFTTKETGKGTGMGLAIIHGIMKEYGGAITVESQLGKGSAFHVFFPVIKEDTLPEKQEPEDIPTGNERVFFIDDEEILAEMGKTMLERLGYHVTVRHSSIEALTIFRNNPNEFDIVITDQTMPDITGSDLAKQMLQIRPEIPIILCTGYSNLIDEDTAKGLGIKAFALKPLTKEIIAKLIRKVLDGF